MWRKTGGASMSKKSGYAVLGIAFIVFSIIVFVSPIEKSSSFWVAYTFSVVAFVLQIPVGKKVLKHPELKSKFMGYPILYIGISYLIIQVFAAIIIMLIPGVPTWIPVIVCVILLGIACIGMISGNMAREAVEQTEAKIQSKVSFIRSLQADVEILAAQEDNTKVKAKLQSLAQAIRYSDPMSSEQLSGLEETISQKISSLSNMNTDKLLVISEIDYLLIQRNKKCKALKI